MIFKVYSKRQKKDVWAINITVDGQRIRTSGFAKKSEAEDAIASLRLQQRARRFRLEIDAPEITLGDLLAARQKDPICKSSRNRERLLGYFEDFVEKTGPEMPVKGVGLSHLRSFRESLARSLKPSSVKFKMAGVIGSLNAAGLYFPELESYTAPRLRGLSVQSRSVLVPRLEFLKLVKAMRDSEWSLQRRTADIFELLALTGARVGEILSIRSDQIDLDRGILTLRSKTKLKRAVPLSNRARLILTDWRTPDFSYWAVSQVARKLAHRNGITWGHLGWRIHDIRHTAASVLAENGVSHSIIAALLGHTLTGTTAIYTHATLPALRRATAVLELWCTDYGQSAEQSGTPAAQSDILPFPRQIVSKTG